MTNQELYTTVRRHLLTQNERSAKLGHDHEVVQCLYRGPEGRKCAIGCLIPDEYYTPHLEGAGVTAAPVQAAARLDFTIKSQLHLAQRLQMIHDYNNPNEWHTSLGKVAVDFGLIIEDTL
jgi:hypothetical protein